ncbi:MAG TPA: hypothetical protein VER36_08125 [Flavisolibacter sp.]|nr:hypothetical protein [Flavisolibacter sp.]
MIPCHDLRTGNIILVNNRLRKVSTITNSNTLTDRSSIEVESVTDEASEVYPVESIDPVPLTDAILQQCSFVFRNYFRFWQLVSAGQPRTEMNIDMDYNIIDFMRRPVVKKVASLHQLQNIYYMLHGRELDFDVDTVALDEAQKNSAFAGN